MNYVLVVDEDLAVRTLAQTALRDAGYPVVTAGDGLAALATIVDACPAMVVLDPWIPMLRGFEMVVWLREAGVTVPIVFMSRASRASLETATPAVDAYLPKPFAPDELLTLVARFLPAPQYESRTGLDGT
jgi:two-component system OmpR family response regulator